MLSILNIETCWSSWQTHFYNTRAGSRAGILLCLNINEEITSDSKSIAEKFNVFFVNVAPKLVPNLKQGKTKCHEYLSI